jgi:EAL domain-containing protein (putative c-di-GMP-specific phosphodiesterase class I)
VDDFGIGQSSFAYLRRLPVSELKIDRAFVTPLAESAQDRVIVRSIVELSHALGCEVTAEGVEDPVTLGHLAGMGCDLAQGYSIARPMAASALEAFVAAQAAGAVDA